MVLRGPLHPQVIPMGVESRGVPWKHNRGIPYSPVEALGGPWSFVEPRGAPWKQNRGAPWTLVEPRVEPRGAPWKQGIHLFMSTHITRSD